VGSCERGNESTDRLPAFQREFHCMEVVCYFTYLSGESVLGKLSHYVDITQHRNGFHCI
jgi:hypothetical protein